MANLRHHRKHLSPLQADLVAATGEFVGTFLFLFFGYAGHLMVVDKELAAGAPSAAPVPDPSAVVYIALSYGFSLLVTVWIMFRISGGYFNPAVTFGMALSGTLSWTRTAFFIPAQMIACMCAGGVVKVLFAPASTSSHGHHINKLSLINTTLAPGVNIAQGLFAEMFFTSFLVFTVLILAAEKSRGTPLAPLGVGLALFVAEIPGVYFTGGALNPARSFGCAVAAEKFPGYHWIYWLGPALGAAMAAGYFKFVKLCHYEEANPGQDATAPEEV
ncbi:aquaporin-like protein [Xylariaceae sp. FL0594]|nr:aquaporin-like protein [Xylariaceae sp. FL0594]